MAKTVDWSQFTPLEPEPVAPPSAVDWSQFTPVEPEASPSWTSRLGQGLMNLNPAFQAGQWLTQPPQAEADPTWLGDVSRGARAGLQSQGAEALDMLASHITPDLGGDPQAQAALEALSGTASMRDIASRLRASSEAQRQSQSIDRQAMNQDMAAFVQAPVADKFNMVVADPGRWANISATTAAESAPSMAALIALARVNPSLMVAGSGALTGLDASQEARQRVLAMPLDELDDLPAWGETVDRFGGDVDRARRAFADAVAQDAGTIGAAVGTATGGAGLTVEGMFANQGGSALARLIGNRLGVLSRPARFAAGAVEGGVREMPGEFLEEASPTGATTLALQHQGGQTLDPIGAFTSPQALGAGALGAMAGGLSGLGPGGLSGLTTPIRAPRTPAEAGTQAAEAALDEARATQPPVAAPPAPTVSPDLDAYLDSMLAPEPTPVVPRETPARETNPIEQRATLYDQRAAAAEVAGDATLAEQHRRSAEVLRARLPSQESQSGQDGTAANGPRPVVAVVGPVVEPGIDVALAPSPAADAAPAVASAPVSQEQSRLAYEPDRDDQGRPRLDARGRKLRRLAFRPKIDDLKTWIAANGGITPAVAREAGIDPAVFRGRANILAPMVPNGRLVRSDGMDQDTLRERMQRAGWLSDTSNPSAPETVDDRDGIDLVADALHSDRGVFLPAAREQQLQRQAADMQMRDADEQREFAVMAGELNVTPEALRTRMDQASEREGEADQNRFDIETALGENSPAADDVARMSAPELEDTVRALRADRHADYVNGRRSGIQNVIALRERDATGQLPPAWGFIDGDGFKAINDTFGHDVGDHVLRVIGETLQRHTGEGLAFRRSGDEFITRGANPQALASALEAAQAELSQRRITIESPEGAILADIHGVGISFGTGNSEQEAEHGQYQNKRTRADAGLRTERGADRRGREGRDDRLRVPEAGRAGADDRQDSSVRPDDRPRIGAGPGRVEPAVDAQEDARSVQESIAPKQGEGAQTTAQTSDARNYDRHEPHRRRIEAVAKRTTEGWANAPKIEVQSQSGTNNDGQFDPRTNTVTLFADKIPTPARARWVTYHEIIGHYGIRGALERADRGLGSFDRMLARARSNPTIDALARAVAFDRDLDANDGRALNLATEEAMAELAAAAETKDWGHIQDRYGVTVPRRLRSGVVDAIARFIESLKSLFVAIDPATESFTDQEWRQLLQDARRYVREPSADKIAANVGSDLASTVYHGSPHRGIEQTGFSLQKIGTGEGNQAFGWGLYFASKREVAEAYREALGGTERIYTVDGERVAKDETDPLRWLAIDALARPELMKPDTLPDRLRDQDADETNVQEVERHLRDLRGRVDFREVENGQLYAADVPEDSDLLDWDKPLSAQPERVRAVMPQVGIASRGKAYDWKPSLTMGEAYRQIAGDFADRYVIAESKTVRRGSLEGRQSETAFVPDARLGYFDSVREAKASLMRRLEPGLAQSSDDFAAKHFDQLARNNGYFKIQKVGRDGGYKAASLALNDLGIPGLRYLDSGSRAAGDGSANYVIWDEGAIRDVKGLYSTAPKASGKPTLTSTVQDQTDTPAFRAWFGESKVVDAQGKPLVVYHGTRADFTAFESAAVGSLTKAEDTQQGDAFFFTDHGPFAGEMAFSGVVMPTYLSLQNPADVTVDVHRPSSIAPEIAKAKAAGHDGVIVRKRDRGFIETGTFYIAFRPEQIKSAIGNRGTFDPNDPSILRSTAPPSKPTVREKVTTLAEKFERDWLDEFRDLSAAERETEAKTGPLDDSRQARRAENLRHGKFQDRLERALESYLEPVAELIGKAKLDRDGFADYLWWRHAPERHKTLEAKDDTGATLFAGISPKDARANIAALDPKTRATYEQAATYIDRLRKFTLDTLVNSGQITPETRDALTQRWQFYVPLRGLPGGVDDVELGSAGAGKGLSVDRNPLGKKALGRASKPSDILEEMKSDLERALIGAGKQEVVERIANLVRDNPELGSIDPVESEKREVNGVVQWVPTKGDTREQLVYLFKGRPVRIKLADPMLTQAVLNMNEPMPEALRILSKATRWLSAVKTSLSPYFMLKNPLRDIQFAIQGVTAENGPKVAAKLAYYYPQTFAALRRDRKGTSKNAVLDRYTREYLSAGGQTGYTYLNNIKDIRRDLSRMFTKHKTGGLGPLAKRAWIKAGDLIEATNTMAENSARLATFAALRDNGATVEEAAQAAKNVTTNFNVRGRLGKNMNAGYLFFNAAVQGTRRFSKLMKSPVFAAEMAMLTATAFALALGQMIDMGDDDDGESKYKKLVRDQGMQRDLVFTLGDEHTLSVPMPYGPNMFAYLGQKLAEITYETMQGRDVKVGKTTGELMSNFANSMSPIQVERGFSALLPEFLRVPVQMYANTDDFGNPISYAAKYSDGNKPLYSEGDYRTGDAYKLFAQLANYTTGGDSYTPGAVNLTPEHARYVTEQALGGPLRLATESYELAEKIITQSPVEASDVPLSNVFVRSRPAERQQAEAYYENRDDIETQIGQYKKANERQDEDKKAELLEESPWLEGYELNGRTREGRQAQEDKLGADLREAERTIKKLRDLRETIYVAAGEYVDLSRRDRMLKVKAVDQSIGEWQKWLNARANGKDLPRPEPPAVAPTPP